MQDDRERQADGDDAAGEDQALEVGQLMRDAQKPDAAEEEHDEADEVDHYPNLLMYVSPDPTRRRSPMPGVDGSVGVDECGEAVQGAFQPESPRVLLAPGGVLRRSGRGTDTHGAGIDVGVEC